MKEEHIKAALYPYIEEMDSLDSIKKEQLIPGYAYLVYSINQTHENGRKYMNNVIITLGYYNTNQVIDEYDIPDFGEMSEFYDFSELKDAHINMTNAIQLFYSIRGKDPKIDPVKDIQNKNLDITLENYDDIFVQIDETHSTKIYKIDLPAIERIDGLKKYIDELKYVPVDKSNISFVGKKYRSAKNRFETRQNKNHKQNQKGGKTKKKNRRNRTYKQSR